MLKKVTLSSANKLWAWEESEQAGQGKHVFTLHWGSKQRAGSRSLHWRLSTLEEVGSNTSCWCKKTIKICPFIWTAHLTLSSPTIWCDTTEQFHFTSTVLLRDSPQPMPGEATNPLYRTGLEQSTAQGEARKNKTKLPPPNKQTNNNKTETKVVERWVYCGESRMKPVPSREKTIISCISE